MQGWEKGVQGQSVCRTGRLTGFSQDCRDASKHDCLRCPRPPLAAPLLSFDHPSPRRADLVPPPGGHSPCHSRTRSVVSASAARSAQLSGAPSSSSSSRRDDSSRIANHWARWRSSVVLAGTSTAARAPGPEVLEVETQPPCTATVRGPRQPCAPETHSVTPVTTVYGHSGLWAGRQESRGGFPRPTHSGFGERGGGGGGPSARPRNSCLRGGEREGLRLPSRSSCFQPLG